MADALVSALVGTILSNLNSSVLQELGVVGGLKTELENLKRTFTVVRAVLRDAEEKQWKSEAIKQWLTNLKDAAYDADDVLDEFTIEAQRHMRYSDLKNRVRSFFSVAHNPLIFRVKMVHKLKTVRETFDAIAKGRHDFHLRVGVGDIEAADSSDWRLTSSHVNKSKIYGRGKEKEDVINSLLSTSNDLSVYAICGMGGIGKTTLAQLIYNDDRVKGQFDLRMWVCVSNDSDIRRLTRAMIESVENSPCDIKELDPLRRRLQEKLSGKKFLLVLDDVWDDYHDKWNSLNDLLRRGAKGSAVVITTRIEMVALKMEPVLCQQMERLSDDDSWLLFEQLAFGMTRREEYVHLEAIGRAIVKKCGGLPLGIKAVGNLMRLKKSEDEWLGVKESEIWDLRHEGSTILPALRLSYDNLPPQLKQCFAFCSIFPKDYVMEKDRLITLWMANGFIACKGHMDPCGMGHQIFNELVGRSFFQDVKDDGLGNITCKLHDLIHDLALSITTHEYFLIEGNKKIQISETIRHVAFYGRLWPALDGKDLETRSLRSFLVPHDNASIKPWSDDFHPYFSRQKYLRALDVKVTKLPESICNLKHLRYLDVSGSFIHKLPESTCSLQNLQTLILRNCIVLYMLPKDMKDMKNLMYLHIKGCEELRSMPAGMGQLTCLQKLSMFIVGKNEGHHIGELNRLNYLGGELSIKNLDDIQSLTEAKDANLMGKKNLKSLSLSWKREISSNGSMKNTEEVLCGLQPHSNLKQLCISGYQGSKFPNWMMGLLLPNLVQISVEECCRCECLPPFGKLQFLKSLYLKSIKGLKCISSDVYGDGEIPFPSLESLTLDSMLSLEEWTTTAATGRYSFPCLHQLTVCNCAMLVDLPTVPSVRTLKIANSSATSLMSVRNFTSLTSLRIEEFCDLTYLPDGMVKNQSVLERLEIVRLRSLKSLSNQLDNLFALKRFFLIECDELESLPEGLQNLNCLEALHINSCGELNSLPINALCGLSSLRRLHVLGCDKLVSLSEGVQC